MFRCIEGVPTFTTRAFSDVNVRVIGTRGTSRECVVAPTLQPLMDFSGFLLPKIPEIEGVKVARRDEAPPLPL